MKRINRWLLTWACVMTMSAAQASLIESFDYDTGAIAGLDGGTGWSGAWGTGGGSAPVITSGSLSAPSGYGFTPEGNKAENTGNGFLSRAFATDDRINLGSDSTYYMSWLIGTEVIGDVSRLNLVDNQFQNRISIGKLGNANENLSIQLSGESVIYSSTSLTNGNFLIVARLHSDDGTLTVSASAFPSSGSVGAEPATWDISTTSTSTDHVKNMLSMNMLMQGASGNIAFDEFRVGSTYASVIPEPSTLALVLASLGVLLAARRRL